MQQEICEFPPFLFPSTDWFTLWLSSNHKCVVKNYLWTKQSAFNRFYIDGPNGLQKLSIPVIHPHQGARVDQIKISYHTNWQTIHLKTLHSVYNNSPFFQFLTDNLAELYSRQPVYLIEFILASIDLCLFWLKEKKATVDLSNNTICTNSFDFELKTGICKQIQPKPYNQVFSYKNGFIPRLSVIDLIFNEGPLAKSHLIDI